VNGLEGSEVAAAEEVAAADEVDDAETEEDELEGPEDDMRMLGIVLVGESVVVDCILSVGIGVCVGESVGVASVTAELGVTVAVVT
jgi:hypothetical protein